MLGLGGHYIEVCLYMLRWTLYRGLTVYVEGYGGHYIEV